MECTGSPFSITVPSGQRTARGCVLIAMAGQAGNPNFQCVKTVGCSDTDSADCKCTLHCACAQAAKSGSKSCIQKPVASSTTCDTATCSSATPVSGGSNSKP